MRRAEPQPKVDKVIQLYLKLKPSVVNHTHRSSEIVLQIMVTYPKTLQHYFGLATVFFDLLHKAMKYHDRSQSGN